MEDIRRCIIHTATVVVIPEDEIIFILEQLLLNAKGKIETYSDKSIVVRKAGLDPLAIPGLMAIGKDLRGGVELNEYLRGGAGYVFPRYLRQRIQSYLVFGENIPSNEREYTRKGEMYTKLRKAFGFTPKPISGQEAIDLVKKAILPYPNAESSEAYTRILEAIKPEREYKHIQLLSMFYDLFHPNPPLIGGLDVHTFYPEKTQKIMYWVSGPKDSINKYISKIESEHPYQMFVAKIYPEWENEELASAWMEHWTND